MLQLVPKHKASEKLQQNIKQRIAKFKTALKKQSTKKGGSSPHNIKKEGAARVALVGTTNSGKSTLLNSLTGSHVEVADYPFTTTTPEVGIMDYHGVSIQVIEIPSITKNFGSTKLGHTHLSLIKTADLVVIFFSTPQEKALLDKELVDIDVERIIYNHDQSFADTIWNHLHLIRAYTKQPGKQKEKKPISLPEKSTVKNVAATVHKDFLARFRFARIYGKSAKFAGQTVGLDHVLQDEDVVEIHLH